MRIKLQPHQGIPLWMMWMLAIMAGVSVANLYYCQPLLNMIRADIGLTEFQVNLIPVFTQIGYAMGLLFIVPMGDLYNRRKTILTCFSTLTVSLLTISVARSVWMLLVASFVTGFFSVAPQIFMPFASLYSRPEEKEQRAGMILSGLLIGILGSRVMSGYVGHLWGWRTMYVMAAVMIMCSALVIARWFPEVVPTYKGRFIRLMLSIRRLVIDHPRSLLYSIRSAFAFGSMLGLWATMAFRMKEAPFYAGSDVVGFLGICGIAGVLTASSMGKYIPRWGTERVNTLGLILQLIAWALLGIWHDSYVGIILGIIIIDIGMQSIQLSNQSATMKLCPEAASRMNTIYMVTYFLGGSFGTFLSGSFYSLYGWLGTVGAGLLLVVCSALSTIILKRVILK